MRLARLSLLLGSLLASVTLAQSPSPIMDSEDVGIFGLDSKIPVGYFRLGAIYPARFATAKAAGKLPPGPHTSKFEPNPEPTLATGVIAMTAVATALLQ